MRAINGLDGEIYQNNREDLIRYATALVGPNDAADVVSSVVLHVLRRGGLGALRQPRPYLFKAVLNESRSVLRRRRLIAPVPPDESNGLEPELWPEVAQAVLDLPARQRAATYLVYWEGLSISETAHLMGARPGTIKRYLHLARNRLRGSLNEQ